MPMPPAPLHEARGLRTMEPPTPMTRRSSTLSSSCRAVLPLLVLGLAACSYSFKAGGASSTSDGAGKPAKSTPGPAANTAAKPLPGTDAPAEPSPMRVTPVVHEPAPVVDPKRTAVCRITDESLMPLCHAVLDPIAADDLVGWEQQLALEATVVHPSHGDQRVEGVAEIRSLAQEVGGVRQLLHLTTVDRVVGTLQNDCRRCRRAFVAFELNSRSGTTLVTVDMTQPPRISMVEIGSRLQRRPLGETVPGFTAKTTPAVDPPASTAPAAEGSSAKTTR